MYCESIRVHSVRSECIAGSDLWPYASPGATAVGGFRLGQLRYADVPLTPHSDPQERRTACRFHPRSCWSIQTLNQGQAPAGTLVLLQARQPARTSCLGNPPRPRSGPSDSQPIALRDLHWSVSVVSPYTHRMSKFEYTVCVGRDMGGVTERLRRDYFDVLDARRVRKCRCFMAYAFGAPGGLGASSRHLLTVWMSLAVGYGLRRNKAPARRERAVSALAASEL